MQHDPATSLPPDAEPAFAAPWQAEAFALAIALSTVGCYTWAEWTDVFSRRLKVADCGCAPTGYFDAWLEALEELVEYKGITDKPSLLARKNAWIDAYERTPHGRPVTLSQDDARV